MAQESEREPPTSHWAEKHGLPPPRQRVMQVQLAMTRNPFTASSAGPMSGAYREGIVHYLSIRRSSGYSR